MVEIIIMLSVFPEIGLSLKYWHFLIIKSKSRVIRQLLASYNLGNLKPYGVTKGLTQLNVKHMYGNI